MSIILIDPRDLHPMENQPRHKIDEAKVAGLANTFEEKGFKGAITIWFPKPGYAEIISGHRSWTAFCGIALKYNYAPPWDKIPCAPFYDIDEAKAYELAILYNEKREDLTLFELAVSWDRLLNQYNFTPGQIAHDFETSDSTVYNTVSILKESLFILEAIKNKQLSLPDILGLRRIKNIQQREKVATQLISGEIPKAALPELAAKLNRQNDVLNLIPELQNDLEEQKTAGVKTRMDIYIPQDFKLYFTFNASTRIDWELLPQRNILVSGYHVLHRSGKQAMVVDMINKRDRMDSLMIDSAGIVAMSLGDLDWFNQQARLVDFANAVKADVVSHLDVLTKPHLLETCHLTVDQAQEITIRNAREMLDLKTKAKKCFVLQGNTDEEYEKCISAFKDIGILDTDCIIGVGSRAGERTAITIARYAYVCKRIKELNPKLGIHAFGIGRPYTLCQLYKLGVSQADNATPQVLTQTNQWIDATTGEVAKGVHISDYRITAMYQSQLLYNYGAYFVGLNNEFKKIL